MEKLEYRIRHNYHCVLRCFKIIGKTCGKICIYLLSVQFKKKDQHRTHLMMFMQFCFSYFLYKSICCGFAYELHRQVSAIQMATYNICLYKEVDKKYTGCNLKTTKLLDCVLIGVYAVIR